MVKKLRLSDIILISGMSGAGKTTVLKTLEDIGYSVVDNIPMSIIPLLLADDTHKLAVGVDIRNIDFDTKFFEKKIAPILAQKKIKFIFLDAETSALIKRYKETRRKPPLFGGESLADGIRRERKIISKIKEYADIVLDSSDLSASQLKNWVRDNFGHSKAAEMVTNIRSFSFRKGIPRDADMVFDVRFLKNPHYEAKLQNFTGTNKKVQEYIATDASFTAFFQQVLALITSLIPRYKQEGKNLLTIAIGCTGGKHRSVFVAEKLGAELAKKFSNTHIYHRDVDAK